MRVAPEDLVPEVPALVLREIEALEALGLRQGRHVGERRRALGRGDRDGLQVAGLQERHDRRHAGNRQLDVTADRIGDRGCRAAVGNVQELGAGQRVDVFAGQVVR